MLTIRAEIKRGECNADGNYNVKVRFTYKRKVKRLSTNLIISKLELNKDFSIKEGSPVKFEVEKLLSYYREKCSKLQLDTSDYTLDEIMDYLKAEKARGQLVDFIEYSKNWISSTSIKGKKNYQSALNSFVSFLHKDHLSTKEITHRLLQDYMTYLTKQHIQKANELIKAKKRVPSNRTVSLYLGSLRHLFNEAKKDYNDYDRNIIVIGNSPFENLIIPKQEATRKRALSVELIKKIYELPYITTASGKEHQRCAYNIAKDCFILSFCLIGMNSVDLFTCSESEKNQITYYRSKTTARRIDRAKMTVTIPSFAVPLFKKYSDVTGNRTFRFYKLYNTAKNFNRALNVGLKEIGKKLNIDDLEFYAARHSWATIALNKCKVDKYTVHAALNHVDESMRVTDIYIERDFVNENKANAKVIKYVFGK